MENRPQLSYEITVAAQGGYIVKQTHSYAIDPKQTSYATTYVFTTFIDAVNFVGDVFKEPQCAQSHRAQADQLELFEGTTMPKGGL